MVTNSRNDSIDDQNFSDPEDFEDNPTNEELLPEMMAIEPRLDRSVDRIIVVDNIPKVGTEKKDKLRKILTNLLSNYGKIINEFYPEDESQMLKGYLYVEYENEQSALDAVSQLNGYRLDKAHSFKVNLFSDIDKYKNLVIKKEDIGEPVPYKNHGNLMWWLSKPEAYDQFCILHNDNYTSVLLNTPNQPQQLISREKWTETRFQWSPKGTYLTTFHERGIALWAGEEFAQFARFSHTGVQLVDFSPCEKFIVTCNPNRAGIDDQALIIWCVRSGQKKRSFSIERSMNLSWPYFKWNHDDKYFARLSSDSLLVYETESFTLLDKKSIKIPHIMDFEWSPTNNYISYWVAEHKNVPARVVLLDIPSKNEIRSKNLVNVVECKMFWQSTGDFLCVRVERYRKANVVKEDDKDTTRYSGIYYNFEFFRVREKQIPVDSLEIKENCYSFAWEPNGQRFAIISGEATSRTTGSFYKIVNATPTVAGKIELIKEFKNRTVLQISWSPNGQYCVLATSASKQQAAGCHAEFYDVQTNDALLLNKIEHEHMTDFEWDSTGRYFVTYVSFWNCKIENAYIISNFQGRQLQKQVFEKLYKFSWRPRPATLLSAEQIKEIKKNLKQYSERYNALDSSRQKIVSQEELEKRKKMMADFSTFRRTAAKRLAEQKAKRLELRRGIDVESGDNDGEEVEYTVQFLVETKKEEVSE